jgi:hypothetical protein
MPRVGGRRRNVTAKPTHKLDERKAAKKQPKPMPPNRPVDHAARPANRLRQLEEALEEGLEGTFPASDAVAAVQPAPPDPDTERKSRKNH